MNPTLIAQEKPLYKLLSDDYLFRIPTVQRPYSWTTDQVGELLDDLLDFIEHYDINQKNIQDVEEPYFLGSIVLVQPGGAQSDILDGQQRLTTITILLAVIRDFLGGEYAEQIEGMIVQKGNKLIGINDTFRLSLRNKDNDFFMKYIQQKGATSKVNNNLGFKTDSQKIIIENVLYLSDRLNDLKEETVKLLPSVIARLCYIVVVSTPNFDSAFRIFTVLNDRGLDLMSCDIFKARVIGDILESEQDSYTSKWEEAEVFLGREKFNKLFDHIRMIVQKRKGSVNYKEEYNQIFSKISGKEFIDELLIPYTEIYSSLFNYRDYYENQPELIKILNLLNRIDNVDWIPPAMYYIRREPYNILEFLKKLEALAGTSMILRKNFNWRMSRYSQILKEIDQNVDILSKESSLEVSSQDKVDVIEKLKGDVYLDLKDTAKRYILLRLDSILSDGQPYYDNKTITVEHILPQNPKEDSEWIKDFKEPSDYVHKLGNLVLLTRKKNSQAKNYEFDKKKKLYFQSKNGISSFAITTQVIQQSDWTPKELQERQDGLIDIIIKEWKLNI